MTSSDWGMRAIDRAGWGGYSGAQGKIQRRRDGGGFAGIVIPVHLGSGLLQVVDIQKLSGFSQAMLSRMSPCYSAVLQDISKLNGSVPHAQVLLCADPSDAHAGAFAHVCAHLEARLGFGSMVRDRSYCTPFPRTRETCKEVGRISNEPRLPRNRHSPWGCGRRPRWRQGGRKARSYRTRELRGKPTADKWFAF